MVRFILGENKYVKMAVRSLKNEQFTISEATYKFLKYGVLEDSGQCEISNENGINFLLVKLNPLSEAGYILEITYKVASETLKEKIEIAVR